MAHDRDLLFGGLELGDETQPRRDALPARRIGFAEVRDLAQLDRLGHTSNAAAILSNNCHCRPDFLSTISDRLT
jgi:hypothetical protein